MYMYIWKWFTTHIRDTGCYFIIALNKSLFYFITICRFWGRNIIAKRLFVHTLCMYIYIAPTRLMIGPTVLPPYTIQHCCSRNMRTTPERHFFSFYYYYYYYSSSYYYYYILHMPSLVFHLFNTVHDGAHTSIYIILYTFIYIIHESKREHFTTFRPVL